MPLNLYNYLLWASATLSATAPAATLLPQQVYNELTPQVNYRIHRLNQWLEEMLKL